jgi:aminomethyltransferase
MGEFFIRGAEGIAALDRLVIGDLVNLPMGRCRYTALLNETGGIIDDCVALRLGQEELYLVTNAGPLEKVSGILLEKIPGVEDVSDKTAKIDIQGPLSRHILMGQDLKTIGPLTFWTGTRCAWRGVEMIVSRAGYTGELGYELYLSADAAEDVWGVLLADGMVTPCGLGARDTLRSEMGYPLNGDDVDEMRTPLEAGMDRFIAWHTEFPGKARLLEMRERGGYSVLTPILSSDRRAPRHGFELKKDGELVGAVTTGTFGPSLGRGVGLAYLKTDVVAPGTVLAAGPRDLEVTVAELPIYKNGTCRIRVA